jgi:hypothetical protein
MLSVELLEHRSRCRHPCTLALAPRKLHRELRLDLRREGVEDALNLR